MIQWMFMTLLLSMNIIFFYITHPLAMGLMLLIQTLLVSLISSFTIKTFWFSYILFLIFLGGMLVLFIYVTSLASNEMFSFSMKIMITMFMMFMFSMMIFMLMNNNMFINFKNIETQSNFNLNSYILENSLSLNKLYNYPSNMMTIMLINYLLITLIVIVKITKLFKGPLRPMFN